MREIKFRFFDKDLNKMCERKPAHNDFSHPNIIPMQFTGLKDKNGKEIYEGDILKAKASDVIHPQDLRKVKDEYVISSIYWNKNECCFETDFNAVWFPDSEKTLEVIGNIYQNKDLIKTL